MFISIFIAHIIIAVNSYHTNPKPCVHYYKLNSILDDNVSLHNDLFKHPEFQLHLPPTSNSLPLFNKHLFTTKPLDSSDSDLNNLIASDSTSVSPDFSDSNPLTHETQLQNESKAAKNETSVFPGEEPSEVLEEHDIMKMLKNKQINEFRHKNTIDQNHMLTFRFERPCDVYVLNYSIIDLDFMEYIYLSCKVLEKLKVFKDDIVKKVLDEVITDFNVPVWLSTPFYYSLARNNDITDFILITYYYIDKFCMNNNSELGSKEIKQHFNKPSDPKGSPDNTIQLMNKLIKDGNPFKIKEYLLNDLYRLNITCHELMNWKQDGTYENLLEKFVDQDLKQLYLTEKEKLRRNIKLYKKVIFNNRISHNTGLVQLINYYTNYFKMPIYIMNTTPFPSDSLKLKLKLFGVKDNTLLNIISDFSCFNKLDKRIPIHYFDNYLPNLMAINDKNDLEYFLIQLLQSFHLINNHFSV
ncbi:uncharacterized protein TA05270 [Theileria annulata]|uniref:Uncharacterized protein n=1 Tax=Theileria annulata TaxID=5874 RepID=Q4UCV0_THEAN|nr:uncharacterized protein TA05270 [Theileria annulata]CAI75351.1 hypothetical protein TA05270 [Theileria annulata]|eukprot:XP_954827.1 hypothetical protein TA05270 [Theileria annulata]